MAQEFHVVRCSTCESFQVQQVKKATRWSCKLCGEKQSLLKEFGRGSAVDCRRHVQKLNAMRGAMMEEQESNARLLWEQVESGEVPEEAGHGQSRWINERTRNRVLHWTSSSSMVTHLSIKHLSITHLSVTHLSITHLSVKHLSITHLSVTHLSVTHLSITHLSVKHLGPERRAERRVERRAERRAERGPDRRAERGPDRRAERGPDRRVERRAERRVERGPDPCAPEEVNWSRSTSLTPNSPPSPGSGSGSGPVSVWSHFLSSAHLAREKEDEPAVDRWSQSVGGTLPLPCDDIIDKAPPPPCHQAPPPPCHQAPPPPCHQAPPPPCHQAPPPPCHQAPPPPCHQALFSVGSMFESGDDFDDSLF
ncbi:uncharacterized protein V6R79_024173 [Siganus canaliculatus]